MTYFHITLFGFPLFLIPCSSRIKFYVVRFPPRFFPLVILLRSFPNSSLFSPLLDPWDPAPCLFLPIFPSGVSISLLPYRVPIFARGVWSSSTLLSCHVSSDSLVRFLWCSRFPFNLLSLPSPPPSRLHAFFLLFSGSFPLSAGIDSLFAGTPLLQNSPSIKRHVFSRCFF